MHMHKTKITFAIHVVLFLWNLILNQRLPTPFWFGIAQHPHDLERSCPRDINMGEVLEQFNKHITSSSTRLTKYLSQRPSTNAAEAGWEGILYYHCLLRWLAVLRNVVGTITQASYSNS